MEADLITNLEKRISNIQAVIASLKNGVDMSNDFISDRYPNLIKMKEENDRLNYRCGILEMSLAEVSRKVEASRSIAEASKRTDLFASQHLEHFSFITYLKGIFARAIKNAYPKFDDLRVILTEATKDNFGDYQCNSAMAISQIVNKAGEKTNPRAVAGNILSALDKDKLIDRVTVEGPGFLNIHLNISEIYRLTSDLFVNGIAAPSLQHKRVVIDFSSPNIAKEMHVGHLRSTIIGDSIARLYEFVGFDVLRLNHVGDWGTQFGMLIAHLSDRFPNYANTPPPIQDLQAFYKESKKRFDEDDKFKKRAYNYVVSLQNGEADITSAWKLICDISRKEFQSIYDRLDVSLVERGESFYQNRMKQVVDELDKAGLLVEEEGRKLVFVAGIDVPLTVVKSDGGYTYDTSDLATIRHRLLEEKGDILIYVVDAGQSLHFELIFSVARLLKWYNPTEKRVEHVQFGVVLGEDKKKFKTRSGDTVRLADLLDEGLKRSMLKLKEKERDKVLTEEEMKIAQEAVAYGCIKYADLSHNRCSDYVFSFDRMLDDRGNTAVYLLYAYTRIRSVRRNAGVERSALLEYLSKNSLAFEHAKEFRLAKSILQFYDVIMNVLNSLYMHLLCEYLYELATAFTEFYDACYCIEKKDGATTIHHNRLILCETTADVMSSCFSILGIRTVERM